MYSPDIEKICALCVNAKKTDDPFQFQCSKKGSVRYNFTCKKFRYDIFKKKLPPRRNLNEKIYTEDDFSIDS